LLGNDDLLGHGEEIKAIIGLAKWGERCGDGWGPTPKTTTNSGAGQTWIQVVKRSKK
jgi:hypothetical protein